jgi:hypothetical protein
VSMLPVHTSGNMGTIGDHRGLRRDYGGLRSSRPPARAVGRAFRLLPEKAWSPTIPSVVPRQSPIVPIVPSFPGGNPRGSARLSPSRTAEVLAYQFVSKIRRWIGCNGRASIGNDDLKRSMPLSATVTGEANTFHSTTSEHGGVVSEPS